MAPQCNALNIDELALFLVCVSLENTVIHREGLSQMYRQVQGGILTFNMYTQVCIQLSLCADTDKRGRHRHSCTERGGVAVRA